MALWQLLRRKHYNDCKLYKRRNFGSEKQTEITMSTHFSATSLLIQLFDMTQNFSLFIHKFASHSIHNICAVDFFSYHHLYNALINQVLALLHFHQLFVSQQKWFLVISPQTARTLGSFEMMIAMRCKNKQKNFVWCQQKALEN